ncbi:fatty acid desaturase family protein, partial [Curtobacterium flaccumfaciens]
MTTQHAGTSPQRETSSKPLAGGYRKTGSPAGPRTGGTSSYSALLAQVKEAGLLERRRGFYWALFSALVVATAACWVVFAFLGDSWFQLIVAGALGVLFTQFAFLSHEAAHRQVFESQKWNDRAGRWLGTFLVGLSYSWWMNKHTRHHGNPNTVGKDPDIAPDAIRFLPEDAAAVKNGPLRVFVQYQGWLFFPLLTLEGINLHRAAVMSVLRGTGGRSDTRGRVLEGTLLVARFAIYLTVVFWFLPFGMACAFLGVQLAVFGVMMG